MSLVQVFMNLLVSLFALVGICSPTKVHHVIIEVNVSGEHPYEMILSNASNLLKAFAPEKVEIEVVCEGPGIHMLLPHPGALAKRIAQVHAKGVVFAGCQNTLTTEKIKRTDLFPFAIIVDSGVAEVVRKQEAGWSYLKGAF